MRNPAKRFKTTIGMLVRDEEREISAKSFCYSLFLNRGRPQLTQDVADVSLDYSKIIIRKTGTFSVTLMRKASGKIRSTEAFLT